MAPTKEPAEPFAKLKIWAARIQATRTIDEAWANFLNFKDEMNAGSPPSGSCEVYHSMFEKLVFEQRRLRAVKQEKVRAFKQQSVALIALAKPSK